MAHNPSPAELDLRAKALLLAFTQTLREHDEKDLRVISLAATMLSGITTAAAHIPLETYMPIYLFFRNASDEKLLDLGVKR